MTNDNNLNKPDDKKPTDKELKDVQQIYAVFFVSLILGFIPMVTAAGFSILLFLGGWIGAYWVRAKGEPNGIAKDHMNYVILTVWVTGLISLISMIAGTAYLLSGMDMNFIRSCSSGGGDMMTMMLSCYGPYLLEHPKTAAIGGAITIAPVIIYLLYRLCKGLSRALKGHRMGESKSWF